MFILFTAIRLIFRHVRTMIISFWFRDQSLWFVTMRWYFALRRMLMTAWLVLWMIELLYAKWSELGQTHVGVLLTGQGYIMQ